MASKKTRGPFIHIGPDNDSLKFRLSAVLAIMTCDKAEERTKREGLRALIKLADSHVSINNSTFNMRDE